MTDDDGRKAFAATLQTRLDRLAADGRRMSFWWRDDDAVEPTPALDRLLDAAARAGVPVALAVIPKGAKEGLAERLGSAPRVSVLQHGWQHLNHQPAGSKAAELGDARPLETVLDELRDGRRRLEGLFASRFRPVLVPPWNRIAPAVAAARRSAGLAGLSTFTESREPAEVNCHLDPIAWKAGRGFVGWTRAAHLVAEELDRRIDGSDEPFGLLTHHLVHDGALWDFVDTFLAAAAHPAADWPDIDRLFAR